MDYPSFICSSFPHFLFVLWYHAWITLDARVVIIVFSLEFYASGSQHLTAFEFCLLQIEIIYDYGQEEAELK